MTDIQIFKQLHHQDEPLLLGNVWNVQSAKIYQKLGYKALATSSSALAHSLGYEDGEEMSFGEYFYMVERILKSVDIPLSVDLEGGYGKTNDEIVSNILKLAAIGVAGINIEDSVVINGNRKLLTQEELHRKLEPIISELKKNAVEIFINLRTDPFLLGIENPVDETLQRIKILEELRVDGIFVPCITSEDDIKVIVNASEIPVNVMCMPGLPDFETLKKLGVKRISSGNFLNEYIYNQLEDAGHRILSEQSFLPIFV
ncbi:isocitrate lyase/phosphoenolpyruvate mutase family protein [Chryseobacterium oranimense]|uniref:isocitrate lyase/PEP mutase family protein n=1 Tax=Chryseobacterium oranimense TaxID=421058 RepID=UPI0021AEB739|nr:isocitrate lyase/phosphoenolpyruvate mutase family protein [Chryseobacterium oranimense]UWX62234.1 isocitrate lyase/phosphoenolpyruvate mutase family protein [Chryseobacterium oranimense]